MTTAFALERIGPGKMRASGRIDTANAAAVLDDGARAIDAPAEIDLSALSSADSVTLAVLLAWGARTAPRGGVRYSALPPHLRALARLSGVEVLLETGNAAPA